MRFQVVNQLNPNGLIITDWINKPIQPCKDIKTGETIFLCQWELTAMEKYRIHARDELKLDVDTYDWMYMNGQTQQALESIARLYDLVVISK